eukprot:4247783-Amphidinium_carterae.1
MATPAVAKSQHPGRSCTHMLHRHLKTGSSSRRWGSDLQTSADQQLQRPTAYVASSASNSIP